LISLSVLVATAAFSLERLTARAPRGQGPAALG